MRHVFFRVLGLLEFLIALVLLTFAWQIPGPEEVRQAVGRVERVSQQSDQQVRYLQGHIARIRERTPDLRTLAGQTEKQMRLVTETVRKQPLNYDTVREISQALGDVAAGLDSLAIALDPDGFRPIASGLQATADFLEEKVAPAAEQAADRLEKTTSAMKADAERLEQLLESTPPERKAVLAVLETVARFEDGLDRTTQLVRAKDFETMLTGLEGLEVALQGTAKQVERISHSKIPEVKVEGFLPRIEEKPFWPDGKRVAEGLSQAARGVKAAHQQMARLGKEIPRLHSSLEQSRKAVSHTRAALELALQHQKKLDAVLEGLPSHAHRLAVDLPLLSGNLTRILRDTARLKEVAERLRQAQKTVEAALLRWPDLRKNLTKTTDLLRQMQDQVEQIVANRKSYEESLQRTLEATDSFATSLPGLAEQLEEELLRQQDSLGELSNSIVQVNESIPPAVEAASRLLILTRLLLVLVALLVGLHAGYMTFAPEAQS